jgi:hypothetical protein
MPFWATLAEANSAANDNRRAGSFMEDLTTFDVYRVPIGESTAIGLRSLWSRLC